MVGTPGVQVYLVILGHPPRLPLQAYYHNEPVIASPRLLLLQMDRDNITVWPFAQVNDNTTEQTAQYGYKL